MTSIGTLSQSRARLALSWPLVVGALVFAVTLALGPRDLADPDIYFHIVTGRWIIAHGVVPHADLFSFTMRGAPWVAHEWLAEVIMALAYDGLGWHGLVIAAGLAVATAMAVLVRALLRWLDPAHALVAAGLAFLLLLPHLLARPHLFALPVMVAWIACLTAARDRERPPPLGAALLMVPWVNLHASFLFGLGFAAMLMGEAVLLATTREQRLAALRGWARFMAAAVLASFVTPNGFEAYLLPYRLLHMQYVLANLIEWQNTKLGAFQPLEVWLLLVLLAGFTLRLRLPLTRIAMVLLLAHMALAHWRYGELLGFSVPLLIAAPAAAQLARFSATTSSAFDHWMSDMARPGGFRGTAVTALIMVAVAGAFSISALQPPDLFRPAGAIEAVRDHRVEGPVLNDYNFGGYLIFSGIPTFIDGRADMYGDSFVKRESDAVDLHSDDLPALLDEFRIAWTLLPPDSRAVVLLDHLPDWHRLYADSIAVVHVRSAPLNKRP
jgi:hypothetical protein